MACCCDGVEWDEQVFKPRRRRGCTDVLCLLLLLATWAGMGTLVGLSINKQPSLVWSLIYPQDDYDQYCGRPGTSTSELPKKMFPDLDGDFQRQLEFLATAPYWEYYKLELTSLCAESCPQGTSLSEVSVFGGPTYPTPEGENVTVPTYYYTFKTRDVLGYCLPLTNSWQAGEVELCVSPTCIEANETCATIRSRPTEQTTWEICSSGTSELECKDQRAKCDYAVIELTNQEFTPTEATVESTSYTRRFGSYLAIVLGAWDSILDKYWLVIVLGMILPILLGFFWMVFLFLFAALIVYTLMFLLITGLIVLSVILCLKAGWVPDEAVDSLTQGVELVTSGNTTEIIQAQFIEQGDDAHLYYYYVAAVCSIIVTVLATGFILFNLSAVRRTIAIVEETTKVFRSIPILLVWPVIPLVLAISVAVLGVFGFYFIAYPTVWDDASSTLGLSIFFLLGLLWTLEFLQAAHYASVASATAYWYVNDSAKERGCCHAGIGFGRMTDSSWTIISRHLGSMAFGALIIAVCQVIRVILHAIDQATKEQQKKNFVIKLAVKCAQCAMWCLQKTIEFVSTYSYVFVAINGTTFCRGCRDTFKLIVSYPAQTAINQTIKKFLTLLISWTTPVICAVLCFFILDNDQSYKENYAPLYPALTVFLGGFLLSVGITTVLEASIDTIYLCAFKDMEANKNGPTFMSNDLRKAFGLDVAKEEAGKKAELFVPAEARKQQNGIPGNRASANNFVSP